MKKLIGILVVGVFLIGCAGAGPDSNKTPSEIAEAVKTMDLGQIQSKVEVYKKEIEKKSTELEPIMAKLKEIPLTEMMGEEAKNLKTDVGEVKAAVKVLKEKLDVYVKAYNDMK